MRRIDPGKFIASMKSNDDIKYGYAVLRLDLYKQPLSAFERTVEVKSIYALFDPHQRGKHVRGRFVDEENGKTVDLTGMLDFASLYFMHEDGHQATKEEVKAFLKENAKTTYEVFFEKREMEKHFVEGNSLEEAISRLNDVNTNRFFIGATEVTPMGETRKKTPKYIPHATIFYKFSMDELEEIISNDKGAPAVLDVISRPGEYFVRAGEKELDAGEIDDIVSKALGVKVQGFYDSGLGYFVFIQLR